MPLVDKKIEERLMDITPGPADAMWLGSMPNGTRIDADGYRGLIKSGGDWCLLGSNSRRANSIARRLYANGEARVTLPDFAGGGMRGGWHRFLPWGMDESGVAHASRCAYSGCGRTESSAIHHPGFSDALTGDEHRAGIDPIGEEKSMGETEERGPLARMIERALSDPQSVLPYRPHESSSQWQTRAVLAVIDDAIPEYWCCSKCGHHSDHIPGYGCEVSYCGCRFGTRTGE